MTALQVSAVYSCVDLISGSIATLPFNVFERIKVGKGHTGKALAFDHDLYDLLHDSPNPEMSSHTFRKTVEAHMLLWGNGYAEIERDNGNRIQAIWPLNPSQTRPRRLTQDTVIRGDRYRRGQLVYLTTDRNTFDEESLNADAQKEGGYDRTIVPEDILHIPGLALDGRIGQDVVQLSRQAIGLSLALEKYASKYFGNGAIPGGLLEVPFVMKPEAKENLKRSWLEAQGGENQHRVAVLEKGMKFTPMGGKPQESQSIEAREFQREEIASIFHVPIHMLASPKGASRANMEQMGREFVTFCLGPHLDAWCQEVNRKLLIPKTVGRNASKKFFVKFDTWEMLLPDGESRGKYYQSMKLSGNLSTNDVREMENLNPIDEDWADDCLIPVNTQFASMMADPDAPKAIPEAPAVETLPVAHFTTFRDALGRYLVRENKDYRAFSRIFAPVYFGIADAVLASQGTEHQPGMPCPDPVAADVARMMKRSFWHSRLWSAVNADVVAKKELDMVTRAIRASVAGDKLPDDDQSGPLLYVLRHGSTQLNTEGKFRGWIDVSLDDAGRKQAEEAGKWLKDKGIGLIVSSPLKRSRETADIAAKAIGVSVGADEELLPWNLGELAGTSKADNMDRLNHYIDNPSEPIPGGESLNAFLARYHKLMRTYLAKATSESPVMLSAHTSNVIASDKFVDEESEGRPEGVDSVGPGGIYAIWKEGSAYRGGPVFGAVRPGDFKS